MNRTHLVQRLMMPYKTDSDSNIDKLFEANPFSFGGGLKNGGIPENGMKLIKNIFQFDYMGSSEFEWGAVPNALCKIAKNAKKYIAHEILIPWKFKNWEPNLKKLKTLKSKSPVYIIDRMEWSQEVTDFIKRQAVNPYNNTDVLKESTLLGYCLAKSDSRYARGWLELDNGYFFFIDKEMFDKTCKLFNIKKIEKVVIKEKMK